jgi:hypothetical protein
LESTEKSSSTENNETRSNTEPSQEYRFVNHPKIAKFLANPEATHFIEEYLVNIQAIDISNQFLLFTHINKFKELKVRKPRNLKIY